MMRKVALALLLPLTGSIFFFGWAVLAIVFLSVMTCVTTEWLFVRTKGEKGKKDISQRGHDAAAWLDIDLNTLPHRIRPTYRTRTDNKGGEPP